MPEWSTKDLVEHCLSEITTLRDEVSKLKMSITELQGQVRLNSRLLKIVMTLLIILLTKLLGIDLIIT